MRSEKQTKDNFVGVVRSFALAVRRSRDVTPLTTLVGDVGRSHFYRHRISDLTHNLQVLQRVTVTVQFVLYPQTAYLTLKLDILILGE